MPARKTTMLLLALALLVTSCGTPTQEPSGGSDRPEARGGHTYEAVLAEVKGMGKQARWDRLVDLAEQEEGTFQVYATLESDQLAAVMEDFVQTTGSDKIKTSHYRSGSVQVLERVTQEAEAGRPQADALITIAIDLNVLGKKRLLHPLDTPYTENISDEVLFPKWAGIYINVYTLARNNDLVRDSDAPRTWEEALQYTKHPVGIEVQSYDWFATLVTQYFMERKGMTQQDAVEVFTGARANLVPVRGRSTLTELTAAGEYALGAGAYTHEVDVAEEEGAPIAWEPPVQPLVQRPNGVAAMADTDMPATTLLFVDYMLSKAGQKMLASFSRVPTNQSVEGALSGDYDILTVDVADMVKHRKKWTDLYSRVTGEPVDE